MLILDGVYIERGYGSLVRFQWVKAPTSDELAQLTHTIARRVGRFLERQGLIERVALPPPSMGSYRIAVGPHQGRKVFTLQTLPACDPDDPLADTVGKTAGFPLHAGVAAKARERDKLERLCRYIALHGCRVLRRLGTIASAQDRPYPRNVCR